ncbi:MAG: DUF4279 domain-containing protein [Pontixanthobacter sp.]
MPFSDLDEEPSYFSYSATLRIHGGNLPFDEISSVLGVSPSHLHKAGEQRRPSARPYKHDAWHYTAPVAEEVELTEHLRRLWQPVKPHILFLRQLDAVVDVFCGYRSNNGAAAFAVEPDALEIFIALNVPFGVSVIVDSWLGERLSEPTTH